MHCPTQLGLPVYSAPNKRYSPDRSQLCWGMLSLSTVVLDYGLVDWTFGVITLAREGWGKLLGWRVDLKGCKLLGYRGIAGTIPVWGKESAWVRKGMQFFNICVILTSLKMLFHVHHLIYYLTINVGWVYYEPSTVQDTRVRITEIDSTLCSPRAKGHPLCSLNNNSVKLAD